MSNSNKYLIPLPKPIWNNCGKPCPVHKTFLGTYYNSKQWQLTCADKITLQGCNTGNCFFVESVVKELGLENCTFYSDLRNYTKEYVEEQFSAIVVPASNFLSAFECGFLRYCLNLSERYDLPMIFIGLGCQLADNEKLHPKNADMIKKISERCVSIGVRGEKTAEVLSQHGINNFDIIGCPTAFSSLDPEFKIEKNANPDWSKPLAFNTELQATGINLLYNMIRCKPVRFYMQNEPLYWFESDSQRQYVCPELSLASLQRRTKEITLPQFREIRQFITENGVIFFNVADWQESLRECVMSLGMRFHGNMMALQAGIPAVWGVHDNRTRELLNYFKLPTFQISDDIDPVKIYDEADFSAFNSIYTSLYRKYCDFLRKNNLSATMLN